MRLKVDSRSKSSQQSREQAAALAASEERYRSVVDQLSEGVVLQSADLSIVMSNPAAAQVLGLTVGEIEGRSSLDPPWAAIHEDGRPWPARDHPGATALRTGEPQIGQILGIRKPDGSLVWINANARPIWRPGRSEPFAVVSSFTDITAERERRLELDRQRTALVDAQALAHVGSWSWSPAADLADWSAEMYRIFGRDPAEGPAAGAGLVAYVHPDDREHAGGGYVQPPSGSGGTSELEYRIVTAAGEVKALKVLGRREAGGRYVGTMQDVTERRQIERSLGEAEGLLGLAFEHSPLGMTLSIPDRRVLRINRAFAKMLGYSVQELIDNQHPTRFTHPDDQGLDLEHIRMLLDGDAQATQWEKRYLHADGQIVWARVSVSVLRNPDRSPRYLVSQVEDISARRQHESGASELRASEERFRLMVDGVQDYAILMLDTDGNVATWNVGAERFKGYRPEEIIGRHFSVFYPPEDIAAGKPERELALAAAEGRLEDEGWRIRKDGTRFWANVVITALRDAGGRLCGYGKVTRDLTERRAHELELIAAHAQAMEASRLKSAFLANMSHEIRTPLNGVIGMAGLLLETGLDSEQREYADAVRASGDALISLIDDILDFSKIEAGKLELDKHAFDPRELAEDACTIIGAAAGDKGLELMSWVEHGVARSAYGDAPRVRQILVNLLANAVKFTSAGEVVVNVSQHGEAEARSLRFEVRDTGIGVDHSAIDKIFDSFAQADNTTTRRYGGTGLGLAISRRLVELMGGQIGADSIVGEGSVFWFTVPVGVVLPEPGAPEPIGVADLRTLIVAGNATARGIIRDHLASWEMTSETAVDGAVALDVLRAAVQSGRPYQLVLIDSGIPQMSGLELAARVKSDACLSAPRLLLLSASSSGREAAADAGIDGFVSKPVRESRLRGEILRVLGQQTSSPRPDRPDGERSVDLTDIPGRPRVLVADDIPVNQQVLRRLLEKRGCSVDVASDGREAVDMYQRGIYAAIFMDCQMPTLDGYQATAEIRRGEGSGRHTPIVAVTAHALTGDRERCLTAGMDEYLAKPVEPTALDIILTRTLRSHGEPRVIDGAAAPAPAPDPGAGGGPAVFDPEPLAEICGGDDAVCEQIVAMFLEQAGDGVAELCRALSTDDRDAIRLSAHALTGSSTTVGAERLAAITRRLCDAITVGDPVDAAADRAELTRVLEQTRAAFSSAAAPDRAS